MMPIRARRSDGLLDAKLQKMMTVSIVISIVLSVCVFVVWGVTSPPTITQEIVFPEKFANALDRAEMVQLADVTYTAKDESGAFFSGDVTLFKQLFVAPHCTYAVLETVCSVVLVGTVAGADNEEVHVSHIMLEQTPVSIEALGDLYRYKSGHFEGNVFHVTAQKTREFTPSVMYVFFMVTVVIFLVLFGIQLYFDRETSPEVRS